MGRDLCFEGERAVVNVPDFVNGVRCNNFGSITYIVDGKDIDRLLELRILIIV